MRERLREVILEIIEREGPSNAKIAKDIGVYTTKVDQHRRMVCKPDLEFIVSICKKYGFNTAWVISGEGPKYCKNEGDLPEATDGNGNKTYRVSKPSEIYNKPDDFGHAVDDLREIFDSRDPVLIPVIQANLRAFRLSALRERQNQEMAHQIKDLTDQVLNLNRKCNEMIEEIAELKRQRTNQDITPEPDRLAADGES